MSDLIRAAGAVLWRPGPEVLLIHRPRYDDWSLPKGKQEPGEHMLLTAVREVREETTVRAALGPMLPSVSYEVRGEPKRVSYWLAYAAAASPDNEVDAVAWVPLGEAGARLSYPHDRDLLAHVTAVPTVPLIIVRHATAVPKSLAADPLRPLDGRGTAIAAALAGLLTCFAPRARVISSPALRCVQTVQPYADQAGVPLETDDSLAITKPSAPLAPLLGALARSGTAAIVSLHRENLPEALAAACTALGAARPGNPVLSKGSFWVLHIATGTHKLAAAERYDPLIAPPREVNGTFMPRGARGRQGAPPGRAQGEGCGVR
ncbi:MAG TPA: NUDIX hydrolase [Streptosporangiaceae bacterium]|nr:NUDIX hydrolase [Streptosporangiaceae bacterium]